MFDKMVEIPWRRSGGKKNFSEWTWPAVDQVCLIYFFYTGFSISKYEEEPDAVAFTDGKVELTNHIFYDLGGFLTDEDLLWIPINELTNIGSFQHIIIPESYTKDFKTSKEA